MNKTINIIKKGNEFLLKEKNSKKNLSEMAYPVDDKIIGFLEKCQIDELFGDIVDKYISFNLGHEISNGIPVNTVNNPNIYNLIKYCSETLGIQIPNALVSNDTYMNAYTTGTDKKPVLVLTSFIVNRMSEERLKFIIGHECGHIAMQHVLYHFVSGYILDKSKLLTQYIPLIGPIISSATDIISGIPFKLWMRISEITADRLGLLCCKDLKVAQKALLQLLGGFQDIDNIDIDEYIRNTEANFKNNMGSDLMELVTDHPLIYKRIKALEYFSKTKNYNDFVGITLPENEYLSIDDVNKKVSKLLNVESLKLKF